MDELPDLDRAALNCVPPSRRGGRA